MRRDKPAYANEVYGELFYAIGLSPGEEWQERERVAVAFANKKKYKIVKREREREEGNRINVENPCSLWRAFEISRNVAIRFPSR